MQVFPQLPKLSSKTVELESLLMGLSGCLGKLTLLRLDMESHVQLHYEMKLDNLIGDTMYIMDRKLMITKILISC